MGDPHTARCRRPPDGQRGQVSSEYLGVLLLVAVIIAAILVSGVGRSIADGLDQAICKILQGGDCTELRAGDDQPCKLRSRTTTDKATAGINLKYFSGATGAERVVIKEEFDDGTAKYTITDKASLEAALGGRADKANPPQGREVKSLGGGGVGGNITAKLAAVGALKDARQYITSTPGETKALDEKIDNARGGKGLAHGAENALDVPRKGFNKLPFVPDVPDVDGILLDQVIGEEDLPEPDTQYVGGDIGGDVSVGAREDQGPASSCAAPWAASATPGATARARPSCTTS